jgi:integrase
MQTYKSKLRIFMSFLEDKKLSGKSADMIHNDVIIEFLKKITIDNNLARRSVEKYQQILYTLFKYIEMKKGISKNPVTNVPRLGCLKDEAPAAIPAWIRKKLQHEIEHEDPQLWMAICFIYYSAIRPGTELRLMKLSQINYSSRTITIKNYLAKNGRTEVVDIPDQLYHLIVNVWKLQDYDQSLFIFGKEHYPGKCPSGKNAMRMKFNKYRDRLNLPKEIKYYSWKHSGAQELADAGANTYELQRHLRHRELSTTEVYLRKRIGQRSNTIRHDFPSI